ncbi:hypothetical protein BpHYR1_008491 [Brachionus plicatilis]|uniref:Uncharacterized protein n=1 Tax=Brachionus plicatilis TaxID=10195 RepID=A0A3M7PW93_BRAPC|nr:hypothetical protein BpHYR1_008491 [Brachionus plicatilis]
MLPIETKQSMFDEPSSGSKHTIELKANISQRVKIEKQSFIYASNEPLFYNKCVETLMGIVQKG